MQLALPQSVRLSTRDFGLLALALGVVLTAIWAIALRDIRQVNQQAYHAALASVEHDTDQLALEWEAKLAYIDALYVRAREITRMMLTGNADQETAAAAINEGGVFRFLAKPVAK